MPHQPLGHTAQEIIARKIDEMFARLKARYIGPRAWQHIPQDKRIVITTWAKPDLTLEGIFQNASALEGVRGDTHTMDTLAKLAGGFLDAAAATTKAQVLREVTAFLTQAQTSGVKTDLQTVLGGKLAEVMGKVRTQVDTIIDAETSNAKNLGLMDGITRVNAHLGIVDPCVYFMVVRDGELCKECKRVHLMEDGATPRLWLLSEVKQGYHKRGEDSPSIGGLHPHCRCTMGTLMPGYGFNKGGMVEYKSPDHNEFEAQQKFTKTEAEDYPVLEKRDTTFKEFCAKVGAFGWRAVDSGGEHVQFVHDYIKPDRPPTLKRGHRTGKFDAVAADDMYAKAMGLRYNQKTGEVYVDPKHRYAPQYRTLGMLPTEGSSPAPAVAPHPWTPAVPHQHVDVKALTSTGPKEAWRTQRWVDQMQDPSASVAVPPIKVQKTPSGGMNVVKGHHRLAAAQHLGLPSVPVVSD